MVSQKAFLIHQNKWGGLSLATVTVWTLRSIHLVPCLAEKQGTILFFGGESDVHEPRIDW